jgi:hypothetical protein
MMHVLLLAALLANTQLATPAATVTQPAAKPSKNMAEEKKVCRREIPTGSIMPKRFCKTQKEWDELSASGQETVKQVREKSSATMGTPAD